MNLRISIEPQQGYNKIFDVGEFGMKLTKFGLLKLAKGTSYEGDTGESEVAFVLIGGKFRATACRSCYRSPTYSSAPRSSPSG